MPSGTPVASRGWVILLDSCGNGTPAARESSSLEHQLATAKTLSHLRTNIRTPNNSGKMIICLEILFYKNDIAFELDCNMEGRMDALHKYYKNLYFYSIENKHHWEPW